MAGGWKTGTRFPAVRRMFFLATASRRDLRTIQFHIHCVKWGYALEGGEWIKKLTAQLLRMPGLRRLENLPKIHHTSLSQVA
jgi:hypothetical protein